MAGKRVERLNRLAQEITEITLRKTGNLSDYMTVVVAMLGNGVAALSREKSDEVFDAMLGTALGMVVETANWARDGIETEGFGETKH